MFHAGYKDELSLKANPLSVDDFALNKKEKWQSAPDLKNHRFIQTACLNNGKPQQD